MDCVPREAASWESGCNVIKLFQEIFEGLVGLAWYLWTKLVVPTAHFFFHTSRCWLAMGHQSLETDWYGEQSLTPTAHAAQLFTVTTGEC